MSKRIQTLGSVLCLFLFIINCAKRGSITGGEEDTTPPEFVKASPPNYTTNFKGKEVRIYFDELIKLKDVQKQILISPPMDPKPVISPQGSPAKFIKIKFTDTLLENTTYSINFGESIVDNNEENPLPFFKYVFSTGSYLDSLKIEGQIQDALKNEPDPFVSVLLYEVDSSYTDSMVFKEVPRYITSTLDSTLFSISNIKEGSYKLIALKDKSNDFRFQPDKDRIGFYEKVVTLPEDTATFYTLRLFQEVLDFEAKRPKQESKYKYMIGYEGVADSVSINVFNTPDEYDYRILEDPEKDTLYYWYKPFWEVDSLVFNIRNGNRYEDTIISRHKDMKVDSLDLSRTSTNYGVEGRLDFRGTTPLQSYDTTFIKVLRRDSTLISHTIRLDSIKNVIEVRFKSQEDSSYVVEMLPGAVTDFYGMQNDTIQTAISIPAQKDFGTLSLNVRRVLNYPILIQLTDTEGKVKYEKTQTEAGEIKFANLEPAKYLLRIIFDRNKNNRWDTGNFLKNRLPERVTYYPKEIDVRANWDLKETFTLDSLQQQ